MAERTRIQDMIALVAARLAQARWTLIAAALAALFGVGLYDVSWGGAFAAVLAVGAAAAFSPLPTSRSRALERRQSAASPAWPDSAMRSMAEAVAHPAMLIDRRAIVRVMNRQARAAFEATRPGDPLTLSLRSPGFARTIEEAARAGRAAATEFREGADGRFYEVYARPVERRSGDATFLLVVFEDVSERIAMVRMRADFVANASHELRTPLASLIGFIETLQGAARDDAEARERFLSIMLDQAQRMSRLVHDLFSLSRIEMNVHRRPTDAVDLVEIVNHSCETLRPLAEELAVTIELEVGEPALWLVGERDELIQVMQNLIENALKYAPDGRRIEVDVRREKSWARVDVRDFGPGIAKNHLSRLTERFYRVDTAESRAKQGTGLGLAIVKHILNRHRGELHIESRLGEGSRFTVLLPIVENAANDSAAQSELS